MTANRLINFMTASPFRPFRVHMASGKAWDIRHPEMIQVGRITATIFTWMNEDEDDTKEREQEVPIILVESIEPLRDTAGRRRPDQESHE